MRNTGEMTRGALTAGRGRGLTGLIIVVIVSIIDEISPGMTTGERETRTMILTSSGGDGTTVPGEVGAGAGKGEERVLLARTASDEAGGERRGRGPGAETVLTKVGV